MPDGFDELRQYAGLELRGFLNNLAREYKAGFYAEGSELPMLLGALFDNKLVAIGIINYEFDRAADSLRVSNLVVRSDFRNLGIGKTLASEIMRRGLALAPRLTLYAHSEGAAIFWEKMGFKPDVSECRTHILAC